jgi:hypothetical protein
LLFIGSENSDTENPQSSHSQVFNTGMADSLKSTLSRLSHWIKINVNYLKTVASVDPTHIWTPRLLQDKFSQLMPATEIMIAAIYPVS